MPDKEIRNVVEKIFYSPATNGKAEQSINEGVEAVQKLLESARYHQSTVEERDERDFRQQIIDVIGLDLGDGIDKLIELFKQWHNELSRPATHLSESGEKGKEEKLKGYISYVQRMIEKKELPMSYEAWK